MDGGVAHLTLSVLVSVPSQRGVPSSERSAVSAAVLYTVNTSRDKWPLMEVIVAPTQLRWVRIKSFPTEMETESEGGTK